MSRFRVLTTPQLAQLLFDSHKRAATRLLRLHELRVLDRFRPHSELWGAQPWHWVVGPLGAAVLAADRGGDPDAVTRRWRGERALAYAGGQRLAHLVGTNEVYVALAAHGRRSNNAWLVDWLTEAECARWTEGIVRPDGWGVWHEAGTQVEFFLEYDRGTETLGRLVAKLEDYERFETERGVAAWVLFAFTSPRREEHARRALQGATVAVATASLMAPLSPTDDVWAPLASTTPHLRLVELAAVPKPPETARRTVDESLRAWRFERPHTVGDTASRRVETT